PETGTYMDWQHGYQIAYPAGWMADTVQAINTAGALTSYEVTIRDTAGVSFIRIACYPSGRGQQIFAAAQAQYEAHKGWYVSGARQIQLDGQPALLAEMILTTDGRGHALQAPMHRLIADVMLPDGKEEIQIQLCLTGNTGATDKVLHGLLSSFRFIRDHDRHKADR
ncbi:MAG: hypothetical protein JST76_03780, partial [Bacteroidetes bacterium]|nr:hypothetical protein [Bacteroidota bacterium]